MRVTFALNTPNIYVTNYLPVIPIIKESIRLDKKIQILGTISKITIKI